MSKMDHIAQWQYDAALEILQKCRERQDRGWPESDSEWEDDDDEDEDEDEDDEDDDEEEEEDMTLKLNVEAIPLFDLPYRPSTPSTTGNLSPNEDDIDSGRRSSKKSKSKAKNKEAEFPLRRTNTTGWSALEWVQIECGEDGDLG